MSSTAGRRQNGMSNEPTTGITEVRTVAIPVNDQDQAFAFYTATLGLELRVDATYGQGQRWVEVAPAGAATSIALTPAREEVRAGVDTDIRLTTRDADADHAHLLARRRRRPRGAALARRAEGGDVQRLGRVAREDHGVRRRVPADETQEGVTQAVPTGATNPRMTARNDAPSAKTRQMSA